GRRRRPRAPRLLPRTLAPHASRSPHGGTMILGRRRRSAPAELPTLAQARPAGEFVAGVLSHLRTVVDVGWNLLDVDAEAHRLIREAGATSCYIDYHPVFGASPFGHVICTSVNEGVLHGRPY